MRAHSFIKTYFLPSVTPQRSQSLAESNDIHCDPKLGTSEVFYILINTFSLVKIRLTHHNLNGNQNIYRHETSPITTHFQSTDKYTVFKIKWGHFNNQLSSLQNILPKKKNRDTFGVDRKQRTTAIEHNVFRLKQSYVYDITLVSHFILTCRNTHPTSLVS